MPLWGSNISHNYIEHNIDSGMYMDKKQLCTEIRWGMINRDRKREGRC